MNRLLKKHSFHCRNLERNRRIQFNMNIGQNPTDQDQGEENPMQQEIPFNQDEIEFFNNEFFNSPEDIIIS